MGVARMARVWLFSRDIESIIVPTAISQPDNERAVSGGSCLGKLGINKDTLPGVISHAYFKYTIVCWF